MTRTNVEYAPDQITVNPDCPFGCKYCWASTAFMRHRTRNPKPIEEASERTNDDTFQKIIDRCAFVVLGLSPTSTIMFINRTILYFKLELSLEVMPVDIT